MAGETELEKLVLRLLSDVEGYIQPLRDAVNESQQAAKQVEDYGKQVERFGDQLQGYGRKLSLYVTAPLTAMAGIAVAAFGKQEDEEIKLRGILAANERQVESLFTDYATYASTLQKLTVVGDETTLGMLRMAESLGVSGDAAKLAIKEAMGLASAIGMSERAAIRYTAMLAQGDTMMLQRYVPTLRSIEDQGERVAEAHRVLGRMFAVAQAEANSFMGQLKQLWNATGDLMEQFGKIIAAYLKPFVKTIKELVLWFQMLPESIKHTVVVVGALIAIVGPTLIALGTFIKLLMLAEAGLKAMSIAALLLKAKMILYTIATKAATVATIFFKAVANPIGFVLIATAISAAALAVVEYRRRMKEANDETGKMAPKAKEASNAVKEAFNASEAAMASTKKAVAEVTQSEASLLRMVADVTRMEIRLLELQSQTAGIRPYGGTGPKSVTGKTPAQIELERQLSEAKDRGQAYLRFLSRMGDDFQAASQFEAQVAQAVEGMYPSKSLMEYRWRLEALADAGKITAEQMDYLYGKMARESPFGKLAEDISVVLQENDRLRGELTDTWDEAGQAIADFAKREFITPEQLALVEDALREQYKLRHDLETKRRGESLMAQYVTPFEQAKKEVEDLNQMLDVIGEDKFGETYRRAVASAVDEFRKATAPERYVSQGVEAIRRGSVQEAILRQEHRIAMLGPSNQQTKQESQLEELIRETKRVGDNTDQSNQRGNGKFVVEPAGLGG